MSDRVALNGRSTCDERTCDRNTRDPFLNRAQACLAPKPPVFESRSRMRDSRSRIITKLLSNYTFQTQQQYYMDKNSPEKQFKSDVTN